MNASGYKITNRYSPGFCGWQTSEQFKIFKLFPANFCGVTLTESAVMNPIKSVSGLFGVGQHVEYHEYHCELCDAVNCIYRDKK
jgi:cobalamin-dependent methionine synthase I